MLDKCNSNCKCHYKCHCKCHYKCHCKCHCKCSGNSHLKALVVVAEVKLLLCFYLSQVDVIVVV